MSRAFRPSAEPLEGRALLATGLTVSLAAAPVSGATVLQLTETNTTGHAVAVTEGCGVSDFWVTNAGVEVWRASKDGPQPLCLIRLGQLPAFGSRSFTAVWKGNTPEAPPPNPAGPYEFHAAVDGQEADSPPAPPAARNLTVTVTTDRPAYSVGRKVRVRVTETNTGTEPVTVGVCGPESVTVDRGGVPVWQYVHRGPCPALALRLQPGESRHYDVVWPGRFNQNPHAPRTGVFTVTALLDGGTGRGSFRVVR